MHATTTHKHRKMPEVKNVFFHLIFYTELVFIDPYALHRSFTSKMGGKLGEQTPHQAQ